MSAPPSKAGSDAPPAGAPDVPAGPPGATAEQAGPAGDRVRGCELCEAARLTPWHYEDETCWVADCEVCDVPMVVWRRHGTEPPPGELEHMLRRLALVADARFSPGGWSLDRVMRQIPDHFHAHARDPQWWFRRFRR